MLQINDIVHTDHITSCICHVINCFGRIPTYMIADHSSCIMNCLIYFFCIRKHKLLILTLSQDCARSEWITL